MHIHCWAHLDRVRVQVLLEWCKEQESEGMWCGGVCGVEGYVVWRGMWCGGVCGVEGYVYVMWRGMWCGGGGVCGERVSRLA